MCPHCDNYGICDDCIQRQRELCQNCEDRKEMESNASDNILPINYLDKITTSVHIEVDK